METAACFSPALLSPGAKAGKPAEDPDASLLTWAEGLAILKGPPPPGWVLQAGTSVYWTIRS